MQTMLNKDFLSHMYFVDPEKLAVIVAVGSIHLILLRVMCCPPNIGPELGVIARSSKKDKNTDLNHLYYNFI